MNKLTQEEKAIMKWNQYIMWALASHGDTDLYDNYQNMRLWFVDKMLDKNIMFTDLIEVNSENAEMIWFECDKNLDKESFINVKSQNFDVKLINNKYCAVDI